MNYNSSKQSYCWVVPFILCYCSFSPLLAQDISIALLHINDVYEITPVNNGNDGGLARVAMLKKKLAEKNPNTLMVLPGDFYSPSAIGTVNIAGKRLAGKQMVDVLNVAGLDVAALGNHEFDIREEEFYERLAESKFAYVSNNTFRPDSTPFPNVRKYAIYSFASNGDTVKIGFVGTTIPSNPKNYVLYTNPLSSIQTVAQSIRDSVDVLVALTHLNLADDIALAEQCPEIDLILGGHEHENIYLRRGKDYTPIAKADANARTAYVHTISIDKKQKPTISSELVRIDSNMPQDTAVAQRVNSWMKQATDALQKAGFESAKVIGHIPYLLDGSESAIRNSSNALTDLICAAFATTDTTAEAVIFNGGSIRIDDKLPAGEITQYDVLRILPFGGNAVTVTIQGDVLLQILKQGELNKGTGGFLHYKNITKKGQSWQIGGKSIDKNRNYRIVTSDFLITGKEKDLEYFSTETNPKIRFVATNIDVRKALIRYIASVYSRK